MVSVRGHAAIAGVAAGVGVFAVGVSALTGCTSTSTSVAGRVVASSHPRAAAAPRVPAVIAVLGGGGRVLAKQGSLTKGWTTEYAGVAQVAVASDSSHGPLLAVLTKGGQVVARQGSLSGRWTTEYAGVSLVAVASDGVQGPLLAVLTNSGGVLAKQGDLSATWTTEDTGVTRLDAAG